MSARCARSARGSTSAATTRRWRRPRRATRCRSTSATAPGSTSTPGAIVLIAGSSARIAVANSCRRAAYCAGAQWPGSCAPHVSLPIPHHSTRRGARQLSIAVAHPTRRFLGRTVTARLAAAQVHDHERFGVERHAVAQELVGAERVRLGRPERGGELDFVASRGPRPVRAVVGPELAIARRARVARADAVAPAIPRGEAPAGPTQRRRRQRAHRAQHVGTRSLRLQIPYAAVDATPEVFEQTAEDLRRDVTDDVAGDFDLGVDHESRYSKSNSRNRRGSSSDTPPRASSRSGRRRRVRDSACARRQRPTRAWSPERNTSGTDHPRNSAGRV